jgi:hypothetical protein
MNQPGSDLERDLRQALQRKQPSPGFAARVLAKLPDERTSPWAHWFHAPALRWATAAALFLVIGMGAIAYYHHHQQELARGRAARQQLMLALRITGAKLQFAQQRIQAIGADQERPDSPQRTEKEQ